MITNKAFICRDCLEEYKDLAVSYRIRRAGQRTFRPWQSGSASYATLYPHGGFGVSDYCASETGFCAYVEISRDRYIYAPY